MNAGSPSGETLTPMPAFLGYACFPMLLPPYGYANPVCVWNNIGKQTKVGSSKYFGATIEDPARAPTMFLDLPGGDHANLPVGSLWTIQGIILNPASSSPKGASMTNAVVILVQ